MSLTFGGLCPADTGAELQRVEAAVSSLRRRRGEDGEEAPVCAYLYHLDWLRAWVRQTAAALPERCSLYYAVKANPDPEILRTLFPLVKGFEAASGGEIAKIRKVSAASPVLFGGPGKTAGEIRAALAGGGGGSICLHVESVPELHRIDAVAASLGMRAKVLLRVNLREGLPATNLRMCGGPSQFGIDEAELPEAFAAVRAAGSLECLGFHFHSLSNNLDAEAHANLVRLYLRKARGWAAATGFPVRIVNAGGGIGVNYIAGGPQFDWPEFTAALAQILPRDLPDGWELRFECGRYLAAGCGFYAAEVIDLKRNHGRCFAVLRGGTHHFRLPASWGHDHPFLVLPTEAWSHPYPRPSLVGEKVTLCGSLCTPKDVLAREAPIGRLRTGDVVLFRLAGAYGWTISHREFLSHPHPDRVYLDGESP